MCKANNPSRYCAGGTHTLLTRQGHHATQPRPAQPTLVLQLIATEFQCDAMRCRTTACCTEGVGQPNSNKSAKRVRSANVTYRVAQECLAHHQFEPRQECVHIWLPTRRTCRETIHRPRHISSNHLKTKVLAAAHSTGRTRRRTCS